MKIPKIIIILIIIITILGIGLFSLIYHFFFSMSGLPKGKFLTKSVSPKGTYIIKTYLCNGGATTDYSIRGALVSGKNTKNIYWDYHVSKANIRWVNNDTVSINGHTIRLPLGYYDFRHN